MLYRVVDPVRSLALYLSSYRRAALIEAHRQAKALGREVVVEHPHEEDIIVYP